MEWLDSQQVYIFLVDKGIVHLTGTVHLKTQYYLYLSGTDSLFTYKKKEEACSISCLHVDIGLQP